MEDTVVLSSTDFQTSAHQILCQLWNDKDFTDVTLATADDQKISAHKSILSACSPFFAHLLATHPHPAPLLYLRGVQARELRSLLQYMYLGESQVQRHHLDSFLQVGQELGISGLVMRNREQKKNSVEQEANSQVDVLKTQNHATVEMKVENDVSNHVAHFEQDTLKEDFDVKQANPSKIKHSLGSYFKETNSDEKPNQTLPLSFAELVKPREVNQCNQCKETFQKSVRLQNHICKALALFECTMCTLKVQRESLLKEHIEARHKGNTDLFRKQRKRRSDAFVFQH